MLDWQTILVTLFVLAAAAYVARRGLSRLRSFRASKRGAPACAAGCGCSGSDKQTAAVEQKFVEVVRARPTHQHPTR